MTVIAVDIDDTLYSFNNLAREVFVDSALASGDKRLRRAAYCSWTEWRTPADVTGMDVWGEIITRCHAPENVANQHPFPGAARTLTELADHGYALHYISNRRGDSHKATIEWLYDSGFPIGAPHQLTCTMADKIAQLRDCQYIIDDRPKTLVQFVYEFHWKHRHGSENAAMQRRGFGLHTPYNAALTDVPGIKLAPNWALLREYLIDDQILYPEVPIGTAN